MTTAAPPDDNTPVPLSPQKPTSPGELEMFHRARLAAGDVDARIVEIESPSRKFHPLCNCPTCEDTRWLIAQLRSAVADKNQAVRLLENESANVIRLMAVNDETEEAARRLSAPSAGACG